MTLDLHAAAPPLEIDDRGIARVRGTRIALELLVEAFANGASAEEIKLRYPTLELPDVYAVLAYILRNPTRIETYMTSRSEHEAEARQSLPAEMTQIRTKLLSRRDEDA